MDDLTDQVGLYGAAHPDEFAGIKLSDGALVVAFTARLDHHREALRGQFPDAEIRVVGAPYTQAELIRTIEAIGAAFEDLARAGIEIRSAGIGRGFRVVVGLAELRSDWIAELRRRFPEDQLEFERRGRGFAL